MGFEAHLQAVKLSNDRLNHRKRDAEFRALAHTAGVLRRLFPNADQLMAERVWWGKSVRAGCTSTSQRSLACPASEPWCSSRSGSRWWSFGFRIPGATGDAVRARR